MRHALTSRRELLKIDDRARRRGPPRRRAGRVRAEHGRFHIGACDWSIGMRGKADALALARQLGLDGVQVSMGSVENDLQLRQPDVQRAYREAAAATGVQIGGDRARRHEPGALQVGSPHRAMGQRQHRRRACA